MVIPQKKQLPHEVHLRRRDGAKCRPHSWDENTIAELEMISFVRGCVLTENEITPDCDTTYSRVDDYSDYITVLHYNHMPAWQVTPSVACGKCWIFGSG